MRGFWSENKVEKILKLRDSVTKIYQENICAYRKWKGVQLKYFRRFIYVFMKPFFVIFKAKN